ncbi:GH-E family nuclease [Pseudomonas sp. MUP55]|uniref:GH-E family nuclease n=1 Tax=Pseudomonas sp. MUP55 TaxID=3087234 RepID=UPI002A59CBB9|nr:MULTISPECIES: GH-E family nuclease [unclassified Pseudomonas]WPN94686.1 GH-E family nuclease [Pseudomonas sp. MUP56]WPO00213.1 GH-E family nuclease [Pseudomonas sp. MUP55]
MAEPINLAPVRVHAISVTVQPPPDSIVGPAEMLLQQGENGGVQIDAFWRDAMGNEIHESKEMQEEEYEEMRKGYLRAELATLPPFSSFKSGNTIGRVVGETAPTQVPASRANPPIEPETEEEGITGEQILDGIQLGLDVVGLIPVVGEVADIASGIISLARGDYVGAGLSLLSAIPFVGYAGTAGKATRYGAKMAEASGKAAKEVVDKSAKKTDEAAELLAKKTNPELDTPSNSNDGFKATPREKSAREMFLGRTPGKSSKTGREVQDRMRAEGKLRENPITGKTEFQASDKNWYDLSKADMAHKTDAVRWWNTSGRHLGAKSKEVREWMLDSKNYELDHFSINRSAGAKLGQTYKPPTK